MGSTQSKGFSSSESTNGDSRCDVDSVKEMEFQDIEDWLHLNHKEYQHFNEPHKVDYVITDAIFALNHATEESLKSRKEAKSELREAFSLSDFDVQQAEEKAAQKEPPQVTINIEVIRVEGLKPKNKGYNLSIYIPGKIKPTDTNLEEYQGDAENVLRNTYCTIAVEDQKFTSPTVNASLNPEYNYPVHILKKQMRPYTTTISIWESITRREDAIHKTDDRRKSVQADKLLGYVNIDIKNDKIDGWYELKNHKDNEEIKYRGKIYVRISSFIEMKTSIGGREGYLILYKKLIANSLRERCRPGVTSCITDDSTCIKQEGDEKQSAKCLNQETLSDAARLILKQYSCVTSLHSSEVATAQWRICSNFANVDHKFMLKCIEEISSFSEITLTDEEQKVLSSANKMCYSICLKKIKNLTKNFPFVFGDDGSQEIWKVQLENMLRCMKLLCSKTILSESLLEDIQQALTEHTHSLWDKSLAEEPRNFTNTYDRNSEEQMLLKESSLAEKCGGFLEVVHTFYQPVFKREINMSHQKIVHQIVSKNVADRVQPILKRLYKGGRRKSRKTGKIHYLWNQALTTQKILLHINYSKGSK
ncbi:unnamed protein product [Meganyctiphanes norvegica]|uniref:C2 domain-containing protein n=1 Tax=Meganyctiphanes norvegica TaxID=48144 RepID=A0AAV2PJS1_MEGNR